MSCEDQGWRDLLEALIRSQVPEASEIAKALPLFRNWQKQLVTPSLQLFPLSVSDRFRKAVSTLSFDLLSENDGHIVQFLRKLEVVEMEPEEVARQALAQNKRVEFIAEVLCANLESVLANMPIFPVAQHEELLPIDQCLLWDAEKDFKCLTRRLREDARVFEQHSHKLLALGCRQQLDLMDAIEIAKSAAHSKDSSLSQNLLQRLTQLEYLCTEPSELQEIPWLLSSTSKEGREEHCALKDNVPSAEALVAIGCYIAVDPVPAPFAGNKPLDVAKHLQVLRAKSVLKVENAEARHKDALCKRFLDDSMEEAVLKVFVDLPIVKGESAYLTLRQFCTVQSSRLANACRSSGLQVLDSDDVRCKALKKVLPQAEVLPGNLLQKHEEHLRRRAAGANMEILLAALDAARGNENQIQKLGVGEPMALHLSKEVGRLFAERPPLPLVVEHLCKMVEGYADFKVERQDQVHFLHAYKYLNEHLNDDPSALDPLKNVRCILDERGTLRWARLFSLRLLMNMPPLYAVRPDVKPFDQLLLQLGARESVSDQPLPEPLASPEKSVGYCLSGWFVQTRDGENSLDEGRSIWSTPEKRELSAIPGHDAPHHSLQVEVGGKVQRHREYVLTHSDRIYPEYLLAYSRC
eukprot:g30596.t1